MAKTHVVQPGECLSSISFEYGFFVDTLWNDSNNSDLKELRKSPVVLKAGDEVFIPDKREKKMSLKTGATYRFRRKGVPALFKTRLLVGDQPRANVRYTLIIGPATHSGQTGSDGAIQHYLSPSAETATLIVHDGDDDERYELNLGRLDPVDDVGGAQGRLRGLGFWAGEVDGEASDALREAVSAFQAHHGLSVSGELDDTTRQKLVKEFGG
jgi:N-acetylmuramoyl-L-alanine amidase